MNPLPSHPLPLVALIAASLALGACSSSDDEDSPVQDGVTGGLTDGDAGGDVGDDTGLGGNDTGDDDAGDGSDGDIGDTGTDGDVAGGAGDVRRFGLVRVSRPDGPGDDGDAFASFVRFDTALDARELTASLRPAVDTCLVESDADDDGDDLFPGATGRPFDFIGAGDALVFTGDGGTWLTLPRIDAPRFEGYRPESRPLPTPFPGNLVVDIPGADFPAFAAVPVADVAELVVLAPSGDEGVPADTAFRWQAGGPGDARIEIELEFDDVDDVDDGDDIDVTCSAADDGEFSLPRDVLDRLPAGAVADLDLERVSVTFGNEGDALLVVRSEGGGGF